MSIENDKESEKTFLSFVRNVSRIQKLSLFLVSLTLIRSKMNKKYKKVFLISFCKTKA